MKNNSNALLSYLSSNPLSLKVKRLYKSFPGKEVLKGIDIEVNPSETHVILGKSGSGKSLLLRCIAGLEKYDGGKVYLNNKQINSYMDMKEYKIGFVFQSSALFNSMTVNDNVGIYLKEHRVVDNKTYTTLVTAALELVELEGNGNLYPSEISGGMQRRVAIARALAMSPDLILFDEPTAGLDPMMKKTIGELIITLKKTVNTTQIVVTHDVDLAAHIADRISIISNGKIIDAGTVDNLQDTNNETIRKFISTKFDYNGGQYEK